MDVRNFRGRPARCAYVRNFFSRLLLNPPGQEGPNRRIRCHLKQGVWLSHLVEAYQLVFTHVREYCLKREHLGFFEEAQP